MDSAYLLNELNSIAGRRPWQLTFAYGRGLQTSALFLCCGRSKNATAAQLEFAKLAKVTPLRLSKHIRHPFCLTVARKVPLELNFWMNCGFSKLRAVINNVSFFIFRQTARHHWDSYWGSLKPLSGERCTTTHSEKPLRNDTSGCTYLPR